MEGEMDGGLAVGTVGRKYADWGHSGQVWFGIPQNEIVIFVKTRQGSPVDCRPFTAEAPQIGKMAVPFKTLKRF